MPESRVWLTKSAKPTQASLTAKTKKVKKKKTGKDWKIKLRMTKFNKTNISKVKSMIRILFCSKKNLTKVIALIVRIINSQ